MQTLNELKKEGRLLQKSIQRAFKERGYQDKIDLSDAYEWMAESKGAENWAVLSAQALKQEIIQSRTQPTLAVSERRWIQAEDLDKPENADILAEICADAWASAIDTWKRLRAENRLDQCEYIIESTDVFDALSRSNVICSKPYDPEEDGDDDGDCEDENDPSDIAEKIVEDALHDLGFEFQARMLFERKASLDDVYTIKKFADLPIGAHFEYLPMTGFVVYEKKSSDSCAMILDCGKPIAGREEEVDLGEYVRLWGSMHLQRTSMSGEQGYDRAALSGVHVLEANLHELLEEYDTPEDVPEWRWVSKHASFKHSGNGVSAGVYEFMVHTDVGFAALDVPEKLVAIFQAAKAEQAAWIMFHQG